ncbi:MAG: 16S rRNA (guanine(966)-N(2))-methyltransferase RsmD [Candidatus Methylacidiphilales bacterium]
MPGAGRVRVVAGTAGGLWLTVPKGFRSRPTQDRVKQAIFSSLGDRVPEARVLDLFSGTGSLGIEALSRGAASCVFVESDRLAVEAIKANLAHCRLTGRVERADAADFLRGWRGEGFDLVLVDPPYRREQGPLEKADWFQVVARCVVPGGVLVWEHHRSTPVAAHPPWQIIREGHYGETSVTLLRRDPVE